MPRVTSRLTIMAIVALAAILLCVSSQSADVIVHKPNATEGATFQSGCSRGGQTLLTDKHSGVTDQEQGPSTNPINVDSRSESHEVVEKLENGVDECLDTRSGDSNIFQNDVDVVADKSVATPLRELYPVKISIKRDKWRGAE